MAKKETYDRLFSDIAEAAKTITHRPENAPAIAKIILRSKPAILYKYSDINARVKAEFMEAGVDKLDRHKCAACFMVAFEKRLMVTENNKEYETYREKIAITAARTILTAFVEEEAKRQGDNDTIKRIEENCGLVFPPSTCDHKTYEEIWAMQLRTMYKNAPENAAAALSLETNAAVSMAADLFLIESYNKK